jgi:hypothetical protein
VFEGRKKAARPAKSRLKEDAIEALGRILVTVIADAAPAAPPEGL